MYNKVILLGNLTRDPEMKPLPSGTSVCNFSLALNRKYKVGDEQKEEVSYFDIVVFGRQAETSSQYLSKGSSVLVDGRLQQRRWDDKDSGQKRSKVEVVAETVRFMPKAASSGKEVPEAHHVSSEQPPIDPQLPQKGSGFVPF